MNFIKTIDGEDSDLEIAFEMGKVDGVYTVVSWYVSHVDGVALPADSDTARAIYDLLDDAEVETAIMEWVL